MKKTLILSVLCSIFSVSIANAQTDKKDEISFRLGVSWASYDFRSLNEPNISLAVLFDQSERVSTGMRVDFSGESFYWTLLQVEVGPKFLKTGVGLTLGNFTKGVDGKAGDGIPDFMIPISVALKPVNWAYIQARWSPLLSHSTYSQGKKNFSDISAGWQYNF